MHFKKSLLIIQHSNLVYDLQIVGTGTPFLNNGVATISILKNTNEVLTEQIIQAQTYNFKVKHFISKESSTPILCKIQSNWPVGMDVGFIDVSGKGCIIKKFKNLIMHIL